MCQRKGLCILFAVFCFFSPSVVKCQIIIPDLVKRRNGGGGEMVQFSVAMQCCFILKGQKAVADATRRGRHPGFSEEPQTLLEQIFSKLADPHTLVNIRTHFPL